MRTVKCAPAIHRLWDAGIIKRAKKDGWSRSLGAKIKAKAEAMVSEREVSAKVSAQIAVSERQIIETNPTMIADRVINQRQDIQRARSTG